MKRLFILLARMGDVCCGIPSFYALREKYPNDELYWMTHDKFKSLIPKFGKFVPYTGAGEFGPVYVEKGVYDEIVEVTPCCHRNELLKTHAHIIDSIPQWANVTLKSKKIIIESSDEDKAAVDKLKLPKRFITLCTSPSYSVRNYFQPHTPEICNELRKNIEVVTIGGNDLKILNNAINIKAPPLTQTVEIINRSVCYVGQDTGVTWLACSTTNPHKVCVEDTESLKAGIMMGYEKHLDPNKIHDIFIQKGISEIVKLVRSTL